MTMPKFVSIFERMLYEAFFAQPVMTYCVRVRSLAVFALAKTEEPALACLKGPSASGVRTQRNSVHGFRCDLFPKWLSEARG
jgi:hypothetical protein